MKALPAPDRKPGASLWMRRRVEQFGLVGVTFLALASAVAAVPARASADRPLLGAVLVGVRSFDSEVGLESEAAFGARFGMGVSDRFTV